MTVRRRGQFFFHTLIDKIGVTEKGPNGALGVQYPMTCIVVRGAWGVENLSFAGGTVPHHEGRHTYRLALTASTRAM